MNSNHRSFYLFVFSLLLAVVGSGCDQRQPVSAESGADVPAEETIEFGIRLDADAQARLGIELATLESTEYHDEIAGPGTVIAIQPLARAMADLAIAEAAVRASSAALQRTRGLFNAGNAVSRETLEMAERQASADGAGLELAQATVIAAAGSKAPWMDNRRRKGVMKQLASGAAVIVRATFLSGLASGTPSTLRIRKLGTAHGDPMWQATEVWRGPSDPAIPGTTLFGFVSNSGELVQGNHIIAVISTTETLRGIVVPATAVVLAGGQAWCYVVRDGDQFMREPMDLDRPIMGGYFQDKGLQPGDEIVVAGAGLLLARETGGARAEE